MNVKWSTRIMDAFTYVALTICTLLFLLPILWILRTSFTTKVVAYQIPPEWLISPTFANYVEIFQRYPFAQYFWNSFSISFVSTILSVLLGSMAAFWFARLGTGGNSIKVAILGSQMLPPVVLVIPLFLVIKSVGLLDSWLALVVTYMSFNLPYVIWLLIGFFEAIPRDLDEAAEIDGCSKWQAFLRVIVPVAAPGIMASAVFSFIMSWNEFLFALVLSGINSRTLPVAIANLETHQGVMIAELSAATILIILPVIFLSMFIQKYLVRGMTFGSVK